MADDDVSDDGEILYRASVPIDRFKQYTDAETASLRSLMAERAPDASVFEEEGNEPFFFAARASNDRLDSHFTRMAFSSLENYARDANEGVQFQNSHDWSEIGFGRSLRGKVTGGKNAPILTIDFGTMRGMQAGSLSSDDFIRGVRAGLYADVSIGFMPGKFICSICGGDMMQRYNWDDPDRCTHYPGASYDVPGKKKGETKREVCFAWVEDARLSEVSIVYDGSTPGAGIVAVEKARMALAHGRLTAQDADLLTSIYRVVVPRPSPQYRSVSMTDDERTAAARTQATEAEATTDQENPNPDETASAETDGEDRYLAGFDEEAASTSERSEGTPMARLREEFSGSVIRDLPEDPIEACRVLGRGYIRAHARVRELEAAAADGRAARQLLTDDLQAELIRAYGSVDGQKRAERVVKLSRHMSMDELREEVAIYRAEGDKRFPPGRTTEDNAGTSVVKEAEEVAAEASRQREATPIHTVRI